MLSSFYASNCIIISLIVGIRLDKSTNPVPDHVLIHLMNRHMASNDDVDLSFDMEMVMEAGGMPSGCLGSTEVGSILFSWK